MLTNEFRTVVTAPDTSHTATTVATLPSAHSTGDMLGRILPRMFGGVLHLDETTTGDDSSGGRVCRDEPLADGRATAQ
ncbi:MAG TPA: hypothetical protein VFW17_06845 [Ktedonobacterales bacterium]|nr:hypothetical protein [Ktedonobacterales bacterium]